MGFVQAVSLSISLTITRSSTMPASSSFPLLLGVVLPPVYMSYVCICVCIYVSIYSTESINERKHAGLSEYGLFYLI